MNEHLTSTTTKTKTQQPSVMVDLRASLRKHPLTAMGLCLVSSAMMFGSGELSVAAALLIFMDAFISPES